MRDRKPSLVDQGSALAAAELCLINLDVIRESELRPVRQCAFRVAIRQYAAVRRFARDVEAWCQRVGREPDPTFAACAEELRHNLALVRAEFRGVHNGARV